MKDWKTTLGGLISGLAAIFGGFESIRQGHIDLGASAIVMGGGLIYKGWHAADKK